MRQAGPRGQCARPGQDSGVGEERRAPHGGEAARFASARCRGLAGADRRLRAARLRPRGASWASFVGVGGKPELSLSRGFQSSPWSDPTVEVITLADTPVRRGAAPPSPYLAAAAADSDDDE